MTKLENSEESMKEALKEIIKDIQYTLDNWYDAELYISVAFHNANPNKKGTNNHFRHIAHCGQPLQDVALATISERIAENLEKHARKGGIQRR